MIQVTQEIILRWVNTAFNIIEFIVIIWVIRDRRILAKSLTRMAETVYTLASRAKVRPTSTVIELANRKPDANTFDNPADANDAAGPAVVDDTGPDGVPD